MSTFTGETQPENVALSDELDKLGPAQAEPVTDAAPTATKRKRRSGTSGAERARRAKAGDDKPPATPRPARTRATPAPKIAAGMANLYTMAGLGVGMIPSGPAVEPFQGTITGQIGTALVASSADLGKAWEEAAKSDPRVREAIERLLAVSTVGQIIAAHMPIVMVGMAAAGVIPPAVAAGMAAGLVPATP